jgi:hypothetical protein
MSTWAEGNFDNDLAAEILFEIVNRLIDAVQECLEDDNADLVCGETVLMPAIDILLTLGRAYPAILNLTLQEQPVTEWKAKYLRLFEEQSDLPIGDIFRTERIAVITETFSNLEKLIEQLKNEFPYHK